MKATLGFRVRKRREELKLTQRTLASMLDCTTTTLNRIERDKVKSPSPRLVLGLSKHLGIPTQTILGACR